MSIRLLQLVTGFFFIFGQVSPLYIHQRKHLLSNLSHQFMLRLVFHTRLTTKTNKPQYRKFESII